ncbi:hypothetical protein A3742_11620 [Oleiphilus sp. HI0071]|nr:hypothetical protein A3737_11380 [Oleiphilus sp. HI0065]KZY81619.1 hypothetical protein A3742_11620 [Oleiphilus sp. HI0071]KZZ03792.1 hypothetical protein A3744_10805 [Oleiphilus sp. HI0073]KZZ15328.1 hypothetical protein A3750_11810 [Oleiphilus sp. HI0079]KZZ15991.1 hypothetical protein A3751_02580 [Oleiphilus sp. HI0080]KZZ40599.1 hypothetical protein A3758_07665 [Oleiphilus sp. HI0118]KZZ52222.1 hypothetical protein A3760_10570 [Oleiphilus sp. HI0122]KZZ69695.1 hypothetical protein A37
MPAILIFVAMAAMFLLVGFKLYPAYFEHWQLQSVVESFEKDPETRELSVGEITKRFRVRMQTNNIREIDFNDAVTIEKDGGVLYIFVEYESRINIYNNVDAVVTWDETTEIFL